MWTNTTLKCYHISYDWQKIKSLKIPHIGDAVYPHDILSFAARNVNLCKRFGKESDILFYCWTNIVYDSMTALMQI